MEYFLSLIGKLSDGMLTTCIIFVLTLLFSLPLGLLISFGRMSKNIVVRSVFKFYISFMRRTPRMLQLLVVFFGPYYLFRINLSPEYRMIAVIVGFVLNYAAYFAEIYRSGIEAVPIGQREAAGVLGLSRSQTFFRIILPQVIKRIIPPVTNEMITLVKDTSLAFVLTVTEMFTLAKQYAAADTSMIPFLVAAIFYYVFNLLIAFIMERAEKKLNYYH